MALSPTLADEFREAVRRLCGVLVTPDKSYLFEQRLTPVALQNGCRSLEELALRLRGPEGESLRQAVVEAIVTPETSFFRDGHPWEALQSRVLPPLLMRRSLLCWSVAASTGQEAYSLAMLVREWGMGAGERPARPAYRIVGTDVSNRSLAAARAGAYTEFEANRGLTAGRLARHFRRTPAGWTACDEVRALTEFRQLNLLEAWPADLGPFDLVLCRNLLIYFDAPTRLRVLERIAERLPAGGWLLLGSAESLYGTGLPFESVWVGETLLYRRV